MKNIWLMIALLMAGAGCATVPNSVIPPPVSQRPSDRVTPGMTQAMVSAIMDGRVTVGYEIDPDTGVSKALEVWNLYSSEIETIHGTTYQVDRYMLRPPADGGYIVQSELFPVVYKAGLVAAVGRDGLAALMSAEPLKAAK